MGELRNFADIHYGKSPSLVLAEEDGFQVYGTSGVYAHATRPLFKGPAVIVPRKGSLGNPQFTDTPFWASDTTYAVLPKDGTEAQWLYYILANFDLTKLNEATGVPSINREWLSRTEIPDHPFPQQRRIVEILSTVDDAIERTEALIQKHQQIKAGLMQDLFTRGVWTTESLAKAKAEGLLQDLPTQKPGMLRPTPAQAPQLYKESPLGLIPQEWEVVKLDSVANRGSGHTPDRNHPEYWNGGFKWVSLADSSKLDKLFITETKHEISQQGIENSSAVVQPAGGVILSRDAGIGKSAILASNMAVSQHFMCWTCTDKLLNFYLYYWLQFKKREFENIAMGSTIPTIGLAFFKKYQIPVPNTVTEQQKISEVLLLSESNLNHLSDDRKKLQKQKQGLMQDLLTGRIGNVLESEVKS